MFAANQQDHQCALPMLHAAPENQHFPENITYPLVAVYADGGYRSEEFQYTVRERFKVWPTLKISGIQKDKKKSRTVIETNLKPVRWIVERTFGWFNYYRRLARDYEK